MNLDLEKISRHLIDKSSDPKLIEEVLIFAKEAYKDRVRISGENYIYHAIRVAIALNKMGLDPTTIAFGILHDVADESPNSTRNIEIKEIEKRFGSEIAFLTRKISKLSKIRYSLLIDTKNKKNLTREKAENLRRMFLALSGDLRVIMVELVSRLDNLDNLNYLSEEQQKIFSLETLQIFVPIASRLGLSEIRRQMEDKAFLYLSREKYNWLDKNIQEKYEERERNLKKFIPYLKKILKKERAKIIDVNYRVKSYWSTYKKLLRHNMDFDKIHDLLALRIITQDVESCYKVLGIIHKHFKPISEEINDYIAHPKPNGYRSLHTIIFSPGGKITEIQIRTEEMHREAEYGVCAHWSYKENIDLSKEEIKKEFEWVKDASEFWNNFKIDFFTNKIFTLTPKGDIIVLPKESTPIDFAYAVHSDIGDRCESARIDGKIVQLNHTLENGDIVEITVNKKKSPSKDWLRFAKTSLAKSHIKKIVDQKTVFNFPITNFIRKKIIEISEASQKKKDDKKKIDNIKIKQIYLAGQKGMLIHIAKCCNPQPGDRVVAYLTKNRSAVLHRVSCDNVKKIYDKFPEKIIDASWE